MFKKNQNIVYVVILSVSVLLIPLVAMLFTEEVKWTLFDFIVMGVLVFSIGLLFELATRRVKDSAKRIYIGFGLLVIFLFIWAQLAVGIFGD